MAFQRHLEQFKGPDSDCAVVTRRSSRIKDLQPSNDQLPSTPVKRRRRSTSTSELEIVATPVKKTRQNKASTPKTSKKLEKPSKRSYADPKVYAHLHFLQDYIAPNLDVIFCGINPGKKSAEMGHHFGNPTNHFWFCLHAAGFTPTLLRPEQDYTLPEHYHLGLTNLVERPTIEQAELSELEQVASVPTFLQKISKNKPKIVCFVGLGIAKLVLKGISKFNKGCKDARSSNSIHLAKMAPVPSTTPPTSSSESASPMPPPTSTLGLQSYKMVHTDDMSETLFFAVPSTSGRVVQFQKNDKAKLFAQLYLLLSSLKAGTFEETNTISLEIIHSSLLILGEETNEKGEESCKVKNE